MVFSAEPDDTLPEIPSAWDRAYNLRAWSGYKDNILLGSSFTTDSAFVGGGADFLLWRLPIDRWEVVLLGTFDYVRYLDSSAVDQEVNSVLQAQVKRDLGSGWKASLTAEGVYFDQVFDNSVYDQQFDQVQVQGVMMNLKPSLRSEFGGRYWAELQVAASRDEFRKVIDDFWEGGPRLEVGRDYGHRSSLAVGYDYNLRVHDSRAATDGTGAAVPGTTLEFSQHEVFSAWRHHWDTARHWRTATRGSFLQSSDNGAGYYNYWRVQLAEQMRYHADPWEFKVEARVSLYQYENQSVTTATEERRDKSIVALVFRGERMLTKSLKAYAQYEHELASSKVTNDEYTVNSVFAGLDWEF